MDAMNNQSWRATNGITMFRGAIMAGFLVSTLLTALPSVTFADGDGNKGKHSLVQQPYGLKHKSPFATTFATMETIKASMDALVADMDGLKAQVNTLTVANTRLTEDNTKLTNELIAVKTNMSTMQESVKALDTKAADIIPGLGEYLKIDKTTLLNGVAGPHILFSGVNVHVRNGSGATANTSAPYTGLGNLIVGYNEMAAGALRNGSHNLVGGSLNSFSSVGGMVFGLGNTVSGQYGSVLSGNENKAVGNNSAVYGGFRNLAVNVNSTAPGATSTAAK